MADLSLTPIELIDRIAALVPPPRKHKLRYFGALAPNSPLSEIVIAMALGHSGATKGARRRRGRGDRVIRALRLGQADRAHLRSVPTTVLALQRPDEHRCGISKT
jgi:hypothetical protein